MMMVVVSPVAPNGHEWCPDHHAMVMVVVMMVPIVLGQLDVAFPRHSALLCIHRLKQCGCIRNRLQQLGVGGDA